VAGREQELRNDDQAFRLCRRTATPQNFSQYNLRQFRVNSDQLR
jgi:hypothetical protein